MPAPWLVTNPPTAIRASVAPAVRMANPRRNAEARPSTNDGGRAGNPLECGVRMLWKQVSDWRQRTAIRNGGRLLGLERERHRGSAVFDFDFLSRHTRFAMGGFQGVFAGRHIGDLEGTVLAG